VPEFIPGLPATFVTKQPTVVRPDLSGGLNTAQSLPVWNYGIWRQVVAVNDLDSHALSYMTFWMIDGIAADSGFRIGFQIQMGVGNAGFETSIGTWKFDIYGGDLYNFSIECFPLKQITPNARVSMRYASSSVQNVGFNAFRLFFNRIPL
jgi:hypothetical protein